ncbi:MAG: hypothetical protein M3Q79_04475 [bacterium]|nr:hypothetical protein [bacterium]
MFPDNNDNQQSAPADDTTFSGSGLSPAPVTPAVTDPYGTPPNAPVPSPQPTADTPDANPFLTPPAPVVPAAPAFGDTAAVEDISSTDQALNSFLSDTDGPSFLDDNPSAGASSAPQIGDAASTTASVTPTPTPAFSDDDHQDLTGMKQEALTQLQPLVDHLEQSAEEQFKTTMMMIQATDDHRLLKKAFDSAQKITNDKERAQALLDIINEINYFTTNQTSS